MSENDRLATAIIWATFILWMFVEVIRAATIGKTVLRICVGKSDGTPAPTGALVSRWILKTWPARLGIVEAIWPNGGLLYLAGASNFILLISFLNVMNDGKQGWHDCFTATAVYRRRDLDRHAVT